MANLKITELTELTTPVGGDLLEMVDVSDTTMAASGTNKKIAFSNLKPAINDGVVLEADTSTASMNFVVDEDDMASNSATKLATQQSIKAYADTKISISTASLGWFDAGETWTYASAITFTISGDLTTKYMEGMKIKLTQTTVKYFIVTKVAYSSPNTTITIYGGTDYTLANAAITSPYFSLDRTPFGFPMSPTKWTTSATDTTDRSQASPTGGTWYNLGSLSLAIPIGSWRIGCKGSAYVTRNASTFCDMSVTLSTANNSETDKNYSTYLNTGGATGNLQIRGPFYKLFTIDVTTAQTRYLNVRAVNNSMTAIGLQNNYDPALIWAECAYL
jgi:hypothetical protein